MGPFSLSISSLQNSSIDPFIFFALTKEAKHSKTGLTKKTNFLFLNIHFNYF
jgi:hypothetical protein